MLVVSKLVSPLLLLSLVTSLLCIQTLFWIPTAQAQELDSKTNNFLELISTLRENKTITKEQYQSLKRQALSVSQYDDFDEDELTLAINTEGGFKVATYDGQYAFELKGRLMYDLTVFNQDINKLGNGT